MAPLPLYAWYHDHAELWGMSQIADQQLAGLLMWVPMGGVYFAACVFLASRLLLTGIPENVSRDRMLAARNLPLAENGVRLPPCSTGSRA